MHSMTITEKILASHSGREVVRSGDLVFANLDLVMSTDITTPMSIPIFEEMDATRVFDPERIVLVNDHLVPAKDIASAEMSKTMRQFAQKYKISHFYEVGRSGICHQLLPEEGLVAPGDLVVGADSHTCTYGALGVFATGIGSTDLAASWALGENWFKVPETIKVVYKGKLQKWVGGKDLILHTLGHIGVEGALYQALEFSGEVISRLPMADRFTICNMAVEAGAKNGIIEPDKVTLKYLGPRVKRKYRLFTSDPEAIYFKILEYDITHLEPLVALPPIPSNVKKVREIGLIPIDQVFLGSCTNGRIEDFRIAAKILKGNKVAKGVRLILIPGTQRVFQQMIQEEIASIFIDCGGVIGPPTCGPCFGGHMGVMAAGEKVLSTSNRNFVGRIGDPTSEIYLSSPAVAAASAILGRIADPREAV
jgi:3-isopropylmalate/(R)-2-methylmalate dehydratase large subunit